MESSRPDSFIGRQFICHVTVNTDAWQLGQSEAKKLGQGMTIKNTSEPIIPKLS